MNRRKFLSVGALIEWLQAFPPDATVSAGNDHQSGEISVWLSPGELIGRAKNDGTCYGPNK